ncbi:DUF1003 domain-containing protein [Candidatus Shapirobacteria bacterium]|nr:DUF1003 domain-containing protein [Candidatus Shapirobacteria bacterium]
MEEAVKTWHQKHKERLTEGQKIADSVASLMGSWGFIIGQSVLIFIWIVVNLTAYFYHWDPYPFILLNLFFSTQAAFAAPIIMMSQNRQGERDRMQARDDYETNVIAKREIEELQKSLLRIEAEKLNKIISLLEKHKIL